MKTRTYPTSLFFIDQEDIARTLGKAQKDGRYLMIGLVAGSSEYLAFYEPKQDKIVLKLRANGIEELVKTELEF